MPDAPTTNERLESVWRAIETVSDPEIPPLSVVDLGVIPDVFMDGRTVVVQMTPTFAGCPALDVMRKNIAEAVGLAGFDDVRVDVVYDPPWTSDRISEAGRAKLKAFGLAPPGKNCGGGRVTMESLSQATCPFCDSHDTTMESMFGPTLCRAIHYCNACRQSFEQFKPV